jgi:hypothetical protein
MMYPPGGPPMSLGNMRARGVRWQCLPSPTIVSDFGAAWFGRGLGLPTDRWKRRFKEANAAEPAYVIVLVVFFVLFIAGALFFDHPVLTIFTSDERRPGNDEYERVRSSTEDNL